MGNTPRCSNAPVGVGGDQSAIDQDVVQPVGQCLHPQVHMLGDGGGGAPTHPQARRTRVRAVVRDVQVDLVVEQLGERGDLPGLLGRHTQRVDLGAVPFHQFVEDGVAVGEEPVQRGVGHAGAVGDGAGGDGVDAVFVGDRRRGVEDAFHRLPAAGLHGCPPRNGDCGHLRPRFRNFLRPLDSGPQNYNIIRVTVSSPRPESFR